MSTLSAERCVACRHDSPRVTEAESAEFRREVPDWQLLERDRIPQLERVFHFPSFADALAFTNQIGTLAEAEGHHPALLTEWGRVTVTWWTHKIRGLHRNDFIMAAKTDALAAEGGRPACITCLAVREPMDGFQYAVWRLSPASLEVCLCAIDRRCGSGGGIAPLRFGLGHRPRHRAREPRRARPHLLRSSHHASLRELDHEDRGAGHDRPGHAHPEPDRLSEGSRSEERRVGNE